MPIRDVVSLSEAEFEARLASDHKRQLGACDALLEALASTPSVRAGSLDLPAFVIGATFARSVKTFRASLLLARKGYAEQASMLNRSLFEDMAVSYWIRLHGNEAVTRLNFHHELVVETYRQALVDHRHPSDALPPELPPERVRQLERMFGSRHAPWYGGRGGLRGIVEEIEHHLQSRSRSSCVSHSGVRACCTGARAQTSHSANALNQTVARTAEGAIAYSVGPSDQNVAGALLSAYYPLSQLARLVYKNDARAATLERLIATDLPAFVELERDDLSGVGRNDPCPCGSGKKYKKCHGA